MGVIYNANCRMFYTRPSDGKTYCFVPVPLLGESTEVLRTNSASDRLGLIHTLTFNGTLLPNMPALSGVPDESTCISLLDRKRDQLKDALSEDRGDLLIVDMSGYPIVSAKPLVVSLDFEQGTIVQQSPYTVVFSYEEPVGSGYVREYSDTWNFAQQDNDTVSVSHTLSAVGIEKVDVNTSAAVNAKNFVIARMGLDKTKAFAIQTPIVQSLVAVANLTGYNKVISETYSETEGSYEVQESYILSSGAYLDDRSIDESYEQDETGALVRTVTINGTVVGYGDTTFDRYSNAQAGFESFVAPEIGFYNTFGVSARQKSLNRLGGSVGYSITIAPSGSGVADLEQRSISRQFERNENGSVNQTVTTSATIRASSSSGIEHAINYCIENNYPIDSTVPLFDASLSGNIVSISSSRDELQRSFSLTKVYTDQTTALYTEEWSVERQSNVDTSIVTVSIQGTVVGLGEEATTKGTARFAIASGAFFNTIEPLARSRVLSIVPTGYCITDSPVSETLGYSELGGVITYGKTYDSRFKTPNVNIFTETVDVSYQRPAQVIAIIPIPGKASGPILQDQETVTGKTKNLNITYKLRRQTTSCSGDTTILPSEEAFDIAMAESDVLVNNTYLQHTRGEKPTSSAAFLVGDTVSFSRQSYEFSRQVTWNYL